MGLTTAHTTDGRMALITIKILRELLAEAESELADARSKLTAAKQRAATAEQEYQMFSAAVARRQHSSSTVSPDGQLDAEVEETTARRESEIVRLPRTHAVKFALERLTASGDAVGPADIEAYLVKYGRADGRDRVSAALAHLSRKSDAHRVGQAQWLPGPNPRSAGDAGNMVRDIPVLT